METAKIVFGSLLDTLLSAGGILAQDASSVPAYWFDHHLP
jgi:hypothetical protein